MVKGLQKVVPGQSMGAGFPAATYNAMVDVINAYRRGRLTLPNQNKDTIRTSGIVLVKNSTGSNLARGGVVGINGPIIGPDVESGNPYWQHVALDGITPTADHVPDLFAIARQAIPSGKIGYATISGACQTLVYMNSSIDSCASCEIGNSGYLQSRTNGGARILWVESTSPGIQNAIVRLADIPEVGIVRVAGSTGAPQDPVWEPGVNFFDGEVVQWSGQTQACWIVPVNALEAVNTLRGGELLIAYRVGPFPVLGQTRDMYLIYDTNIGKVRVNADDGLDYLEDQFADHQSDPTYTEGHLLVQSETTFGEEDYLLRAFVETTGYSGSSEQALTHAQDSDALVWVNVLEVDVITNLRINSGKIEKQVSRIKVLGNSDLGWSTGLLATTCPEP